MQPVQVLTVLVFAWQGPSHCSAVPCTLHRLAQLLVSRQAGRYLWLCRLAVQVAVPGPEQSRRVMYLLSSTQQSPYAGLILQAHIAGLRHCSQRKARCSSHRCSCSSRRTSIICGSGMLGAAPGGELCSCSCTPDIASVLVGLSAGGLQGCMLS